MAFPFFIPDIPTLRFKPRVQRRLIWKFIRMSCGRLELLNRRDEGPRVAHRVLSGNVRLKRLLWRILRKGLYSSLPDAPKILLVLSLPPFVIGLYPSTLRSFGGSYNQAP